MEIENPTLTETVTALRSKVNDQFSVRAIEGAHHADGHENPLRLNFFSTAIRILFEHLMDTLSPEEEVVKTSWFRAERDDGKPNRGQRILFAIQGGLSDAFVKEELEVDYRHFEGALRMHSPN